MPALALSLGTAAQISTVQFPASPMSTADAEDPGQCNECDCANYAMQHEASTSQQTSSATLHATQRDVDICSSSHPHARSTDAQGHACCGDGRPHQAGGTGNTAASREGDRAAASEASAASRDTQGRTIQSPDRPSTSIGDVRAAAAVVAGLEAAAGEEYGRGAYSAATGADAASEDESDAVDAHVMSRKRVNVGDMAVAARSLPEPDKEAEQVCSLPTAHHLMGFITVLLL